MALEKRVTYKASASYSTLNNYDHKTLNVWMVFHGMGHLSRYFARFFSTLDPETNYIIAPQAPSKYYLNTDSKHVGASWLTREDTLAETKNVLTYVDAVWEAENITNPSSLFILGYSQGVSIATRWIASRKIQCKQLVLHSGGIPKELKPDDFNYMDASTKVLFVHGDQDPYITPTRLSEEIKKGSSLFGSRMDVRSFEGEHEVKIDFLQKILQL